jgi:DNA-binding winged helix-turn-helix (wHTH) protein
MLVEGKRPLRVGSRALEVLIALVERAGELVSKDELMARVWPNTTVEESNVKVHIAALRRILGDGQDGNRYIQTVPGRGYRFVATISPAEVTSAAFFPKAQHNLPGVARLVGCADVVQKLLQHLLTIVGPSRVGNASVASGIAGALLSDCKDGLWLVDLVPLSEPRFALSWLAATLGFELRVEQLLPGLLAAIRERHLLLILDNSEHVFDSIVDLTTTAPRDASDILGREPLCAPMAHENHVKQTVPS